MSSNRVYIAVIGVGGVGKVFLAQLLALQSTYPQIFPVLITRSTKALQSPNHDTPLSLSTWETDLSASSTPAFTLPQIKTYLSSTPTKKSIVIDNTSNQDVAAFYPEFLSAGISVVTPNKKAFSSTWALWTAIFGAAHSPANPTGGLVYHESSVGAGLPVISTLKDLVATGDRVTRIQGVFSGTMSYLFNNFAPATGGGNEGGGGGTWSACVSRAKALGFTEPDPRDDLNGQDVARKLVILARLAGLQVAGTDAFPVQSLIPAPLQACGSGDEFMARLPEFDGEMDKVRAEAEGQGKVVRFLGSVDVVKGEVKVGLEMLDKGSAIAGLKGSDNIIAFYTERYGEQPLIVQGAGAGGDVTAMGVTADLIKVLQRLS